MYSKPFLLACFAILYSYIAIRPSFADNIHLQLPLVCKLGKSCFIQNYVDHDPSSDYQDFMCGSRTYDGHDGTDFRVPSMTFMLAGIPILAAADGVVLRLRDGVNDTTLPLDKSSFVGKECGNGLIINHSNGWQSQYCHLQKNSITVKVGETVKAGNPIGLLGMSGLTEFPHLHFTLRHDGKVIDPFDPDHTSQSQSCKSLRSLWGNSIEYPNDYEERIFLGFQFSDHALSMQDIDNGIESEFVFDEQKATLVVHVRMIGLLKGDQAELILHDPRGYVIARNRQQKLRNSPAQTLIYTGAKRPQDGWINGTYTIKFLIKNKDDLVLEKMKTLQLVIKPSITD